LIFHGQEQGYISKQEAGLYSPDVTVEFNPTAYNNETLFLQFIQNELMPVVRNQRCLLVMDVASFHKTPVILDQLRQANILPALIPPGCTSLLQPLDTAVNKSVKQWIKEAVDEYMEAHPKDNYTIGDKRVMTTYVVATAIRRLQANVRLVQKAFQECGISIRPDGSEDSLIKIKDIDSSKIDFTGWESAIDITLKEESFHQIPPVLDDVDDYILGHEDFLLPTNPYRQWLIEDLQRSCKALNLPVNGGKMDLVKRLEGYDLEIYVKTSESQEESIQLDV